MSEERITGLEIANAEHERTIEELSRQIAEQWAVIDRLQRKLDLLAERFVAVEESSLGDVPITRPPHY
jgi:SlyX protein